MWSVNRPGCGNYIDHETIVAHKVWSYSDHFIQTLKEKSLSATDLISPDLVKIVVVNKLEI